MNRASAFLMLLGFVSWTGVLPGSNVRFMRADSNGDSVVDISDAVYSLVYLFGGEPRELPCADAADANHDGAVDIGDVVFTLDYLFGGHTEPPAPFGTVGCAPAPGGLGCAVYGENIPCEDVGGAIVADHTCTDPSVIPRQWVEHAKETFVIWYAHTSHGSQIVSGMQLMQDEVFDYNNGPGTLSLSQSMGLDLGSSDWEQRTRAHLDSTAKTNVVMLSWCGTLSWMSQDVVRSQYLEPMTSLAADYPHVAFIYMTGHLDTTGLTGNLHLRNEQIRAHCRANNCILFDFADIESYDPDGNFFLALQADDNCDYRDPDTSALRNWADEWCAANPGECEDCSYCAHSRCLNCQLKGRAFWWLLARMAGWDL